MVFFVLFHKEHAFFARVIFAITKKKEGKGTFKKEFT